MKRFLLILLGLFLVIQLIPTSKKNEVVDKSLEITAEEGMKKTIESFILDKKWSLLKLNAHVK